jgi:uncharacterized membrane protein YfcA
MNEFLLPSSGVNDIPVFPLTWMTSIGLVVLILALIFANASGTGGGSLYVNCLFLFFDFKMPVASALSNSLIGLSSLVRFLTLLKQKHPIRGTPLVDYSTAMLFLPSSLLGTKLGIFIYNIFPEPPLLLVLSLLLIVMSIMMFKDVIHKLRAGRNVSLLDVISQERQQYLQQMQGRVQANPDLALILAEEEAVFPLKKFLFFFLVTALMLGLSLIQGAESVNSIMGIKKCTVAYWLVFTLYIVSAITLTLFAFNTITAEHARKLRSGYVFTEGDVNLDMCGILIICTLSFGVGIISAGFGIGGSMLFIPFLLKLGYRPEVASTTSLFVLIFKSFVTVFFFALEGQLHYAYCGWLNIFGVACTVTSTYLLFSYIKKTGKAVIIVLFLAITMVIAAIILPVFGIYRDVKAVRNPSDIWKFKNFCG